MRSRIYPRLFFSPFLIRILACHTIFGAPQAAVLRVPAAQMPPAALALPTPWDCGRAKRHTAPLLRRSAPRPNHGARCSAERKSYPGAPKRCGMWKIAPHLKQPISVVFLFFVCFFSVFLLKNRRNTGFQQKMKTEKNKENTEKKQEQLALPRAVVPGTQGATSLLVAGHSEGMSRMDVARLKLRKAHWTASKAVRPHTLRTNTGLTTIAGQRCVGRRGGLVTGTRESLREDIKRLRPPCVPRATLRHSVSVGTLSGV